MTTLQAAKNLALILPNLKDFQTLKSFPIGRPAKHDRSIREFRLYSKTKTLQHLSDDLKNLEKFSDIDLKQKSLCSSKFSSCQFTYENERFELVLCNGENNGESFEKETISHLDHWIKTGEDLGKYELLLDHLAFQNKQFKKSEIQIITPRSGCTKKSGIETPKLYQVISDFFLNDWGVSLKDSNGYTISSLAGAGTLFDKSGKLNKNSSIISLLSNLGVDLEQVQDGFNIRNNTNYTTFLLPLEYFGSNLEQIFRTIWGYNYFYVKNTAKDWKVMWIDELKLKELSSNIKVTNITYPGLTSKQISIYCSNDFHKYKIDIRNSKGGEYPNDIKVKYLN